MDPAEIQVGEEQGEDEEENPWKRAWRN